MTSGPCRQECMPWIFQLIRQDTQCIIHCPCMSPVVVLVKTTHTTELSTCCTHASCYGCGPFWWFRFANELTGQLKAFYKVVNLQVSLVVYYILHILKLWDSEGWQCTGVAVSTVYSALVLGWLGMRIFCTTWWSEDRTPMLKISVLAIALLN